MGATMTYDPDLSHVPWAEEEVRACAFATPHKVVVGGHVLYRHDDHGDVTDALVLDVDHDFPKTIMAGEVAVRVKPWPTVTLDTVHGVVKTREARARGSAGWLPLDWPTA